MAPTNSSVPGRWSLLRCWEVTVHLRQGKVLAQPWWPMASHWYIMSPQRKSCTFLLLTSPVTLSFTSTPLLTSTFSCSSQSSPLRIKASMLTWTSVAQYMPAMWTSLPANWTVNLVVPPPESAPHITHTSPP